jgi:UDP-N-acetylglucosamine acyltransferase
VTSIDPRAIVSPQAELAADVTVGPFTVIEAGVRIGAGTWIGPHAVIKGPTTIGEGNKIFQFASIGDAPQDLKYQGEPTRLEIGDRNVFREFTTMNRGTAGGGGVTRIGSDNLFMAYTHVAHDCHVGNRVVMANYATLAGHVHLGDWVIMGGYSGTHQFTKVGAHAFIGNNAAVTRDVPPYVMAVGLPAVPHSINSEGRSAISRTRIAFCTAPISSSPTRSPSSRRASRRNPSSRSSSTSSASPRAASSGRCASRSWQARHRAIRWVLR